VELDFYPLDASYAVVRDAPVIRIYALTASGEQACVLVEGFKPYCFAASQKLALEELKQGLAKLPVFKDDKPVSFDLEQSSLHLLGREIACFKLIAQLPEDIPLIREALDAQGLEALEADIPFAKRYMIDTGLVPLALYRAYGEQVAGIMKVPSFAASRIEKISDQAPGNLNVLAFDIETHSPLGKFAVAEENPIIMLGFASESFQKVITWKSFKTELDYVEFVPSEFELISRFKEIIDRQKPDVIVGYFSDGFDLPYIKARAEKYKINLELGPYNSPIIIRKGMMPSAEIAGIIHLDLFKFIRKIMGRSLETDSFDLDSVAKELVDESKDKIDFDEMNRVWESRPEELEKYCRYNLQDALITLKITHKVMPSIIELVRVIGLPMQDVTRMGYSQLVEWHLIKRAREFGELVPSKATYSEIRDRKSKTYEGAFVFEPEPGIYQNIAVFDFRSLYPTIIHAHNISPDTLHCSCCPSELFCKKKPGFVATVIGDLIKRRMSVKQMIKESPQDKFLGARQEVLKTIANSMYGYLGFFGARWYSIECAQSITSFGRQYIQTVIQQAAGAGFKVLYSDTDSVFLLVGQKPREEVVSFVASINKQLPELMELDLEGFYRSALFVSAKAKEAGAKKKYALLSESGKLQIKGFETVRRNTSIIAREIQEKVLQLILTEVNHETALAYVRETVSKLRRREIGIDKVIITTQLRQDIDDYDSIGPHVAVAKRMRLLGKRIGPGTIISYVITPGKEKISQRARIPDEAGEYDTEYYVNNQIIPAVARIFAVFGLKPEDIIAQNQSKLDSFFNA